MIAIGNVKLGIRIEPIYVHELSREEITDILSEQGISLDTDVAYPIDTRLVSSFRTDRQKLGEYIQICKYAFDKKNGKVSTKPNADEISIFDDELKINYELKHLKESETIKDSEKIEIYRQAKATQALFKMFGANNVRLEISFLDRAYFEIQNLFQTIKTKGKTLALPAGKNETQGENGTQGEFRKKLFDREAQKATEKVSKKWQEQPVEVREGEEVIKS